MNHHPHRGGFTLVEVLVSLGVLALLCAVLLPVTLSAREKARQSGCLSGLRQVGQAMLSYTTDNDGLYPPALTPEPDGTGSFTWAAVIAGPMPPRCPAADLRGGADDVAEYSKPMFADETTGYAYNANLNARLTEWHERDYTPKSEPMVRFPLLTVVAFDARPGLIALYEPDTREAEARRAPKDEWGRFNVFFPTVLNESPEGATRHSGAATYLFADGHAKWHKPVEIATGAAHDGVRAGFGL